MYELDTSWFGERGGDTETWRLECTEPSADPVTSLRVSPDGEVFDLAAFRRNGQMRRWLNIGRRPGVDIRLEDRSVSTVHCALVWHEPTQTLQVINGGAKNFVFINGARVHRAIVAAGDLLTLGRVTLLACGRAGLAQPPKLTAETLAEFLRRAYETYGTHEDAARGIGGEGFTRRTFARWLRRFPWRRRSA
jgi:pSer/pThr/pTyr-binding forkhead associated (FHA) protein